MQFTIKQARTYAGLTQEQTAKAMGICRHRYMKIEKDQKDATVGELNNLSRITGIPIRDFILVTDSTKVEVAEQKEDRPA